MKNIIKNKYVGYIISLFPSNNFRIFLYRNLFGYHIYKSHIGWRTIIIVDKAKIIESKIGKNVLFNGPMEINLKTGSWIKNNNTFLCGKWAKTQSFTEIKYRRYLEIGEGSSVSKDHYFDVAGSIVIGKYTKIAGRNSQFWTHGAHATDRDIRIKDNCYIGSAVRFSPGSSIGNNSIVGLGSIVTKKFVANNLFIGGHPAKIIKENYDWNSRNDFSD